VEEKRAEMREKRQAIRREIDDCRVMKYLIFE